MIRFPIIWPDLTITSRDEKKKNLSQAFDQFLCTLFFSYVIALILN